VIDCTTNEFVEIMRLGHGNEVENHRHTLKRKREAWEQPKKGAPAQNVLIVSRLVQN
jgi:hypothetical protein